MVDEQAFRLNLFRNLENDPIYQKMAKLFIILQNAGSKTTSCQVKKQQAYALLQDISYQLLDNYVDNNPDLTDAWQDYLLNLILNNENPFSRLAQKMPLEHIGQSYLKGVATDLKKLKQLFDLAWPETVSMLTTAKLVEQQSIIDASCWNELSLTKPVANNINSDYLIAKRNLKNVFLASHHWNELVPQLANFYRTFGAGLIGEYWAFRVNFTNSQPLVGISQLDQIRLKQLVGYNNIKQQIINNTAKFLADLPANNVLLYGDRGTGKSSMVKALIHEFGPKGLRMVELTKSQLFRLPELNALLKNFPQKFIIFIDDLSFENDETDYKEMKAVLEGSLEVKPSNILIYATSNRRHLIKENFSDRKQATTIDEVRINDTVQEKLSLSDRFGITLIFPSPNQQEYLTIIKSLVKEKNIAIDEQELERLALQWELWHNGRSGRTARQFVDELAGDLLFQKLNQAK